MHVFSALLQLGEAMESVVRMPAIGDKLAGRFRVVFGRGVGPSGIVFKALDLALDLPVAVKVFNPELFTSRFKDQNLLRLYRARAYQDPSLVKIYEVQEDQGRHFITCQLMEGMSLAAVLDLHAESGEHFTVPKIRAFATRIFGGLSAIHKAGAIHGNLKPQNIFVLPDRLALSDPYCLVADQLQEGQEIPVTDYYRGPEQLTDPSLELKETDIYALGLILGEVIAGSPVQPGIALSKQLNRLTTRFDDLFVRSTSVDPLARPHTLEELSEGIMGVLERVESEGLWVRRYHETGSFKAVRLPQTREDKTAIVRVDEAVVPVSPVVSLSPTVTPAPNPPPEPVPMPPSIGADEEPPPLPPAATVEEPEDVADAATPVSEDIVTHHEAAPVLPRWSEAAATVRETDDEEGEDEELRPTQMKMSPWWLPIALILLFLAVAGGSLMWYLGRDVPVTQPAAQPAPTAPAAVAPTPAPVPVPAAVPEVVKSSPDPVPASAPESAAPVPTAAPVPVMPAPPPAAVAPAAAVPVAAGFPATLVCPADMVRIVIDAAAKDAPGIDLSKVAFCIDAFEYPGKGQKPKGGIGVGVARRMCKDAGKRLCKASEWNRACGERFPYGDTYSEGTCNVGSGRLRPSGEMAGCQSADGVFDLVGNASEWADDGMVHGGDSGGGPGTTCASRGKRFMPTMFNGFRCCANPSR